MAIITISRGSYSRGTEVAEKVADKLGYTCLAREVILEASEEYNVPELKLLRAVEDGPSLLDRLTRGKERYIAYVRAALLKNFLQDNVVYHGLAGHFFLQDISHVLKARIMSSIEDRVARVVERDKVSEKEAMQILTSTDRSRQQWGLRMYRIDPSDPSLYDAVIHVGKMGVDGAVDMLCKMVEQEAFQTTPESQARLQDLSLAASVEASVMEMRIDRQGLEVTASDGRVLVRLGNPRVRAGSFSRFGDHYAEELRRRLLPLMAGQPGFSDIEIEAPHE